MRALCVKLYTEDLYKWLAICGRNSFKSKNNNKTLIILRYLCLFYRQMCINGKDLTFINFYIRKVTIPAGNKITKN